MRWIFSIGFLGSSVAIGLAIFQLIVRIGAIFWWSNSMIISGETLLISAIIGFIAGAFGLYGAIVGKKAWRRYHDRYGYNNIGLHQPQLQLIRVFIVSRWINSSYRSKVAQRQTIRLSKSTFWLNLILQERKSIMPKL